MSGIYGFYQWDGAPASEDCLQRMRTAMAYYGPQGNAQRIEGSLGLGHLLLAIHPEDSFEEQPYLVERGLVVCSARLDNRGELLEEFGLRGEAAQTPDGRLVSLAFDRWGEDVSSHLLGDWSLAGWDRHRNRLLLSRDSYGIESLYYYEGKGYLAFASSLKALLALSGVPKEPDAMRLAQLLVCWNSEAERTAYEGFRRLLSAHALTVEPGGKVRIWRHWSPEGRELLRYRRDEEYIEGFLDHYRRAVQSRLRTRKGVGVTLSAGRDSGSVMTLAASLLQQQGRDLTAYTSVPLFAPDGAPHNRNGNEWELASQSVAMAGGNVRHLAIDSAGYSILGGIDHYLDLHDGPIHGVSNCYWFQSIVENAARDGMGILLTGSRGNSTVSWEGNGSALLALRQGRTDLFWRLLLHGEGSMGYFLKRQIAKPLLQPTRRMVHRWRLGGKSPWRAFSALHPGMAEKLDLDRRMRDGGYDPTFLPSPLKDLRLDLFRDNASVSLAMRAEMGARHGITLLDPTNDQSLVEFLLRVPDDQYHRKSVPSALFKRAFRGLLPEPVLAGKRKGLQAADIGHRILREFEPLRESLDTLEGCALAREFLDLAKMRASLQMLTQRIDSETTNQVRSIFLRGLCVGRFLQRFS